MQGRRQHRESSASVGSQRPNVANPMYSSIDHLEARRSFVIQRAEKVEPIPRSNSAAAVSTLKTKVDGEEGGRTGRGGLPMYSTIVPRHLRKHDHSSSPDQDLDQEESNIDGQEMEENQTYSTLNHHVPKHDLSSPGTPSQEQGRRESCIDRMALEDETQTYSTLKH